MKKKKKMANTAQVESGPDIAGVQDLQPVDEFRHFLLRNDSQFSEYLNSPLLLQFFDSHLMREGMISMMAQVLGTGATKDNFFLRTR
jgi:hypothetical protein